VIHPVAQALILNELASTNCFIYCLILLVFSLELELVNNHGEQSVGQVPRLEGIANSFAQPVEEKGIDQLSTFLY
jgi:hypothetical protein